jgi:hypothetical protein
MTRFTSRYAVLIDGTLSRFDRLVFRGSPRKIAYVPTQPAGMRSWGML